MIHIADQSRFLRLPDAVLFDTDNTLYPYDPAHAAAQQAVKEKVMSTFSISGKILMRPLVRHASKLRPA